MSARVPDRGLISCPSCGALAGRAVAVGLAEAGADVAITYHTHNGDEVV